MSTDLPKAYDPTTIETDAYRTWTEARAFHAEPADPGQPYSIVIPPPNVTAALHLGHALNNTLQDILTRWRRMAGDNAVWIPGTDHAGIATQTVVEKRVLAEEGKRRTEFKREDFVGKIQAWKDEYEARITEQLKRMGCSCDWERQAFTMDELRAKAVREAFFRLFKDGLIYRGKRLVNWDPVTQTALADDEVEMEEVEGKFYYLRYPLESDEATERRSDEGREYVTVATTRPETMLGDTAVAINPKDPRAAALRGRKIRLPIVNRIIPIIEDDYVVLPDPNSEDAKAKYATGFLKVTPAHDPNDYEIGRRHNLPVVNVFGPDAAISDKHGWTDIGEAGFLVGHSREIARDMVVKWFKEHGLLEEVKPYRHSIGHSYRSHVPIEPYLSDQWYCRVTDDRLAGAALRALAADQRELSATSRDREGVVLTSRDREGAVGPEHPLADGRGSSDAPKLSRYEGQAYFITFTCYGTWLHGDSRDSVDRRHNLPGTPTLIGDEVRERREFAALKHPPMTLDAAQRKVVHDTIREVCAHRGWNLVALNVRTNHVHVVVIADVLPEKVMNDFKAYSTRRLREAGLAGAESRVWTRHGGTHYLNEPESLAQACQYTVDEQGAPLEPPPFDGREEPLPHGRGSSETADETSRARQQAVVRETPLPDGRGSSEEGAPWQGQLRFSPARYAKTFQTWHENIRDWCISRQLWWGHRIPVWHRRLQVSAGQRDYSPVLSLGNLGYALFASVSQTCGTAVRVSTGEHLTKGECEALCSAHLDGEFDIFICTINQEYVDYFECRGFRQDPDVLDTWFSSALWPMSTLGWPDNSALCTLSSALNTWNPTSVLCTAREIITLWVSRMVMFNLYFLNRLPFKDVFIHAMIQDGHGQKMSKSLGNGVDPVDIIHSHGADAMRFTLASMATNTQDVRMPVDMIDPHTGETFTPKYVTDSAGYHVAAPIQESPKDPKKKMASSYGVSAGKVTATAEMPMARNTSSKFDLGRNFCNKLWNAARFVMMSLGSDEATEGRSDGGEEPQSLPDRWIVSRFNRAITEAEEGLRNYRFDQYAKACYDFFWRDFCDWYLEAIKPAMKNPDRAPRTAAVLAGVLDGTLRLLHPVIPFITEAIWDKLNGSDEATERRSDEGNSRLLIHASWPVAGPVSEADESAFAALQEIIAVVRNVRNEHKVDPKRPVNLSIAAPAELSRMIMENREMIELLATAKMRQVGPEPAPAANAAKAIAAGCEIFVEDMVDPGAEQGRLAKRREELTKQIAAMEGRLANASYAAKAPPHLVQQTRDQLAAAQAELAKLG